MSALSEFLEEIKVADGEAWCNPPGLGRGWKVKHIRSGLGRRVLVEYDGIIVFARNPKHGVCQNCTGKRDVCTHCQCSTCVWEREVEGRGSGRVTPAQMMQLRARLESFRFGRRTPVVALDGE